ncbi:MOSC domain-containing protein [Idiomarina sp. 29L]|uniref:MOSC domain-containing protein n=1 Tax=Idiomarina sp. 29L TaxID=2508877 RepID=UPI001010FA51|nr:MOSC domain-containing protein [Idiomarina sp. 29L]RXS42062.1 MOSC domain-containing protein [Idiomarina sp. 29L]
MPSVLAVLSGKAKAYTRPKTFSAIDKRMLTGGIEVNELGLVGDEVGDPRVHGGKDKAVHCYPSEHYEYWKTAIGGKSVLNTPGAFGENLHTTGLTEQTVCLGDQYQIGSVVFEVSQGRQPCWKLNDRFDVKDMALHVQNTRRTGWYFRVLKPGELKAGDAIALRERPYPDWNLYRICRTLYERDVPLTELEQLKALPLPESWARLAERKYSNALNKNNDDFDLSARTDGPARY